AWAVAADWPQPLNLLRARQRRQKRTTFAMAAVAAGVVAGLGAGWRIEQSAWWQSTAPRRVEGAAAPAARPFMARQATAAPRWAPRGAADRERRTADGATSRAAGGSARGESGGGASRGIAATRAGGPA